MLISAWLNFTENCLNEITLACINQKIIKMKKIVFGLLGLFIVSQFMVSCSSESDVLSQFSKRKYLKKYKAKDVKYENKIEETENDIVYAETPMSNEEAVYASNKQEQIVDYKTESVDAYKEIEVAEHGIEAINKIPNTLTNDYSFWNKYDRKIDFSNNKLNKSLKGKAKSGGDTHAVVLIILCLLIITAPLAVYLYEGSITANFWLDLGLLLLLIGAAIYGLLVCFADVSIA